MSWNGANSAKPKFGATLLLALILAAAFAIALPAASASADAAALCRTTPAPHTLDATQPLNLGQVKLQVRYYACSGAYDAELAKVLVAARAYVEKRAGEVAKPAVVLDIDETSLSNFAEILADDFGFIPNGPCDVLPEGPCGFESWVMSARAEAIAPTLALYKAARAKHVAVFFITGRFDSEASRKATIENLHKVGYAGWAGLVLRPADSHGMTVAQYKSGARAKIAEQGYTIIANIGDQQSDLNGGYAERAYKLPNPFYYIP